MSDKEKVFCMPYIHCIQPSMIMLFWVKLTGYWPHSVFVFMALTASWPKNTHKKPNVIGNIFPAILPSHLRK